MRSDIGRDQGGAALIEAALVLPVLLVLIFGLAELSLYLWQQNLAEKAVGLGIRRAVVSSPVASGPGLTRAASDTFWDGLPPGSRCSPDAGNPCPTFAVTCDWSAGCTCRGLSCGFSFDRARLRPILEAMRAVMPALRPENLQVSYATNGLGYVGRPVPIPVDVTVRIVGVTYDPSLLGILFRSPVPIRASARLPAEDLGSG